jgi:phage terminase large subunit-like protein
VPEFIEEHGAFPEGPHDDMVDTTSMAAMRLLLNFVDLESRPTYSVARF